MVDSLVLVAVAMRPGNSGHRPNNWQKAISLQELEKIAGPDGQG